MGVRHLQTLMQQYVPGGFVNVSIKNECDAYSRKYNERPIIIIDLMALAHLAQKDMREVLCGGRQNLYGDIYEKLFLNLKVHADLVFYVDGPVMNTKHDTWVKRQNSKYQEQMQVMDAIDDGISLDDVVRYAQHPIKTTIHLPIIKSLANKYGKVITAFTRECDAEIARYAALEPRVIAVLANDTDFLIFPGNWKYLSQEDININTLVTKEYSRTALRSYLKLDDFELAILATLNGNDRIQYDDVTRFHRTLVGNETRATNVRFLALANYIKRNLPTSSRHDLISAIAIKVFRNNNRSTYQMIEESLELFNVHFDVTPPTDPLLKLCQEKSYNANFVILKKIPKNFTMLFNDLRSKEFPNVYDSKIAIFCKQIGILLKNEYVRDLVPINYEIKAKPSHQDSYRKLTVQPEYPPHALPPLLELLQRDLYPCHDPLRFELLKWAISDDENFKKCDLQNLPRQYLHELLVLKYLVVKQFILPFEADIILLSHKHVIIHSVPEGLQIPTHLNPRAMKIAFLFTKFHSMIHRVFEAVGLKDLRNIIFFDGVMFHQIYLKYKMTPFNVDQLLGELVQFCIYK